MLRREGVESIGEERLGRRELVDVHRPYTEHADTPSSSSSSSSCLFSPLFRDIENNIEVSGRETELRCKLDTRYD